MYFANTDSALTPVNTARFWQRALCLIGGSLARIGLLEIGLRLFPPPADRYFHAVGAANPIVYRADGNPNLGYRIAPNRSYQFTDIPVHINSLGLRDREPGPADTGTSRILALGDSITFGWRVRLEDSYPKVIERLLNEAQAGRRWEVINAGVGGYESRCRKWNT